MTRFLSKYHYEMLEVQTPAYSTYFIKTLESSFNSINIYLRRPTGIHKNKFLKFYTF